MVRLPAPEVTQRLAHHLGALFVNFGALEHTLSLAVAAAMKLTDDQERAIVRGMFASGKIIFLNGCAKKRWNKEYQTIMAQLSKDIDAVVEYRNDFAHGHVMHDDNGVYQLISFRGQDRFGGRVETINLIQLGSVTDEIPRLCVRLERLADDLMSGKAEPPGQQP
jgi:hypothetical protein